MKSVELQVQRYRLEGIAEEMGEVLQRTAFSPNIKERRDFSCAICDPEGRLVAQAAHIPVHLGAVPSTMKFFLRNVDFSSNQGYLLNDPYKGGTHLPDISYIKPIYLDGNLICFLVNRAHHTDVGGSQAGSMASTKHIDEEGFRTGPRCVTENGELLQDSIQDLLSESRTPGQRITDLEAQLAAARRGQHRIIEWKKDAGESVTKIFRRIMDYSERFVSSFLEALPDERVTAEDHLDNDGFGRENIPLRVTLTVKNSSISFDYTNSADQVQGNLNCPRAVTTSATYYVVRCFAGSDIPMNQGIIRPLSVETRPGSVLEVEPPGPVAAGNVETSQRVVDLLMKAFDAVMPGAVPAASQGTMNNVTFGVSGDAGDGSEKRSYYETLGGGAGGGPDHPGVSGRQVHMTNTQNTPIEEFERRFPLRVDLFRLRDGSGGDGENKGGKGLIKSWTALEDVTVSLITERRILSPYGLRAEDGEVGNNFLETPDGRTTLKGKTSLELEEGQTLTIMTPGGGGWSQA